MKEQQIILASQLEKKHQELEQSLQLADTQIQELEQFKDNLGFLIKSKEKEILSSLGKGVFLKSKIQDKEKLFVEVGSNVIVKKTPEETKKIVENQIRRLNEANLQIVAQLEVCHKQLQNLMANIEP